MSRRPALSRRSLQALLVCVALMSCPGAALAAEPAREPAEKTAREPAEDSRRRAEQAEAIEERLSGRAASVRILGFLDPDETRNCEGARDPELPCVERVLYAAPDDAGLPAVRGRSTHLKGSEHEITGQLLHWGLSDTSYRTTSESTAATVAVERGIWDRGASRLPSGESLWRRFEDPSNPAGGRAVAVPSPEAWLWSHVDGGTLCEPLQYPGDRSPDVTRPNVLVCADGFVNNFTDKQNNPYSGQLFRMGRVEGGPRSRRSSEPHKGEQLLTEYLFVSRYDAAAPWSNRSLGGDTEVGIFRDVRIQAGPTRTAIERFVVPDALYDLRLQPSLTPVPEAPPWWRGAFDRHRIRRQIAAGMTRFVDEISARVLANATLEHNPSQVRSLTALAALRSPPSAGPAPADGSSGRVALRNPGHRDGKAVGDLPGVSDAEPGSELVAGPAGGALVGEISVQIRKLPEDRRWHWVEALLGRAAGKADPAAGRSPAIDVLDACDVPDCPNLDEAPGAADPAYERWQAWQELRGVVLAQGRPAEAEADESGRAEAEALVRGAAELAESIDGIRSAQSPDQAARMSQQLLELLVEELDVHRGVLLVDHALSELSVTVNGGPVWDAETLEGEATGTLEQVLKVHGYPSVPLEGAGRPSNPLAVCEGRGKDEESIRLVDVDLLFEASASHIPAGAGPARLAALSGDAAWDALYEARDQVPFVVVDSPDWATLVVEPVFLLPARPGDKGGRAVYRARWRLWSGWHFFWGLPTVGAATADKKPEAFTGLVLRSGAVCDDTTLVAAHLEPSLVRAALLRGFHPSTPAVKPDPEPPPPPIDGEENPADAAAGASEDATAAADDAAALAETDVQGEATAAAEGLQSGELPGFGDPPEDDEVVEIEGTPGAAVRDLLLERLQHHRDLSCRSPRGAGTPWDDADGDGRSELTGDCDDNSPEFVPSSTPTVFVVMDITRTPLQDGAGKAKTPYFVRTLRGVSGATFGVSMVRDADRELTARHVFPDHRALVARADRWGRRSTTEMTVGLELGWTPVDFVAAVCEAEWEGDGGASCPRSADGQLFDPKKTTWDLSRTGLHVAAQVLATTWGSRYGRVGIDAGAELGLNMSFSGVYGRSSLQRISLLRPSAAGVVGLRFLFVPTLRSARSSTPWGDPRRVGATPRFGRAELAIRTGWSVTALAPSIEGGPLLEVTLGGAARQRAGAHATLTPYRPRNIIGGFVRGDLGLHLATLEPRLTRLKTRVTVVVGIQGSFAIGIGKLEEPEEPDLSGVEALRDLLGGK